MPSPQQVQDTFPSGEAPRNGCSLMMVNPARVLSKHPWIGRLVFVQHQTIHQQHYMLLISHVDGPQLEENRWHHVEGSIIEPTLCHGQHLQTILTMIVCMYKLDRWWRGQLRSASGVFTSRGSATTSVLLLALHKRKAWLPSSRNSCLSRPLLRLLFIPCLSSWKCQNLQGNKANIIISSS